MPNENIARRVRDNVGRILGDLENLDSLGMLGAVDLNWYIVFPNDVLDFGVAKNTRFELLTPGAIVGIEVEKKRFSRVSCFLDR